MNGFSVMKRHRPLISAWVGQGNFGDELLSYGLRLELQRSLDVEHFFYYESGGYSLYGAGESDSSTVLNVGKKNSLARLSRCYFQSLNGYDSVFFGGGSIFHSSNSVSWKHQLLRKVRKENPLIKTAAVGVSLGPFVDVNAERQALAMLQELDLVYCRDALSADFARQLAGKVEVVHGRDLAFSVKALRPQLFLPKVASGRIGISFILDPKLEVVERELRFMKMQALVDFLTTSGNEVMLVGLYSGTKYADDLLNLRLYEGAKNKELVRLLRYDKDLAEVISGISSCSFYISMRLHGLVTAFLSGVPCFSLNPHPKVVEFFKSVTGFGGVEGWADLNCDISFIKDRITESLRQPSQGGGAYNTDEDDFYLSGSRSLEELLR